MDVGPYTTRVYRDLFIPCTKFNVETIREGGTAKSNIEAHGGLTTLIRPDCLSISVGRATAKGEDVTYLKISSTYT